MARAVMDPVVFKVPMDRMGGALRQWLRKRIPPYERAVVTEAAHHLVQHVYGHGPVDTGQYLDSVAVAADAPNFTPLAMPSGARLQRADIAAELRGKKTGSPVFIAATAERDGYPYPANIEFTGWPGRAPYRTFANALADTEANGVAIEARAAVAAVRGAA